MDLESEAYDIYTLEDINNKLTEWGFLGYREKITNDQFNKLRKDKLELFEEEEENGVTFKIPWCAIFYNSDDHGHLIAVEYFA